MDVAHGGKRTGSRARTGEVDANNERQDLTCPLTEVVVPFAVGAT